MDGTDAARRLGAEARTASIPVVALSSLPLEGGGDWLQAAGFAGWLEKPIRVGEFPDQIRRYCAEAGT
jgi:two-component system cell cycle response regulator DivK